MTAAFPRHDAREFDAITRIRSTLGEGAAMLYSQEFFELVRAHLIRRRGYVVRPLYSSSEEAVKSEVSTFFKCPERPRLGNTNNGAATTSSWWDGPNVRIDLDRLRRACAPDFARWLPRVRGGYFVRARLLSTYAGRRAHGGLMQTPSSRGPHLRLQYLAGLGLNLRKRCHLQNLLAHRRMPEGVFVGSNGVKACSGRRCRPAGAVIGNPVPRGLTRVDSAAAPHQRWRDGAMRVTRLSASRRRLTLIARLSCLSVRSSCAIRRVLPRRASPRVNRTGPGTGMCG